MTAKCVNAPQAVGFVPLDSRHPNHITADGCNDWGDENDGAGQIPS